MNHDGTCVNCIVCEKLARSSAIRSHFDEFDISVLRPLPQAGLLILFIVYWVNSSMSWAIAAPTTTKTSIPTFHSHVTNLFCDGTKRNFFTFIVGWIIFGFQFSCAMVLVSKLTSLLLVSLVLCLQFRHFGKATRAPITANWSVPLVHLRSLTRNAEKLRVKKSEIINNYKTTRK